MCVSPRCRRAPCVQASELGQMPSRLVICTGTARSITLCGTDSLSHQIRGENLAWTNVWMGTDEHLMHADPHTSCK